MNRFHHLPMSLFCSICLLMFGYGSAIAVNDTRLPDPRPSLATKLTASTEISAQDDTPAAFVVQLTTVQGTPLIDKPLKLLVDGAVEIYTHTDTRGYGVFPLPAVLLGADHDMHVDFIGQDDLAATAITTRVRVQAPATAAAQASPAQERPPAPQHGDTVSTDTTASAADALGKAVSPASQWLKSASLSPASTGLATLIVANEIVAQPGDPITLVTRLVSDQGLPLAGQEVTVLCDSLMHIRAITDEAGVAVVHMPDDMPVGDHELLTVFAGNNVYRPRYAMTTLHYHMTQPGQSESSAPTLFTNTTANVTSGLAAAVPILKSWRTRGAVISALVLASFASLGKFATLSVSLAGILILGVVLTLSLAATPGALRRSAPLLQTERRDLPAMLRLSQLDIPQPIWYVVRIVSIGVALGVAATLFLRPVMGLFLFWRVIIPLLPLVFFVAPGFWRNACPMAALNQTPRLLNLTRGITPPKWLQKYSFVIAISLFLTLASTRKVVFNQNGPALALLMLCALTAAFVMGLVFKGKSGWCSSICPLLPVQRVYGQTPFAKVKHAHCEPCLGCTRNCYDLSPDNAYLADLYDDDRQFSFFRRAFAGLFPGFVLAFYLIPNPPTIAIWQMYAGIIAVCAFSMGTYFLAETTLRVTSNKITSVYGAAALNLYYWFNAATLGSLIASPAPGWFVWTLRGLVLALTLFWIKRTYRKEPTFIELVLAPVGMDSAIELPTQNDTRSRLGGNEQPPVRNADNAGAPASEFQVSVEPENIKISVPKNRPLLEAIESSRLPIESGCRMGLCGADPICVLKGMDNLSKVNSSERTTLERLALGPHTRLACMARVRGDVKISLTPEKPEIYRSSIVTGFRYNRAVERVVIVGNGIAGVTAADHIRRRHPHCEIHLIGREPHHLYNRMGITRLIYGRSAMQGLYLLPDQWYDDFNITCWLNTHVTRIDAAAHTVALGTGETLPYDRLILTTGSQSFVPSIAGFGLRGCFVLRTAEDAISIRAYVQEQHSHHAVIAGGGLLGLEAAYALHKLGLNVAVLERSSSLLTRQLDERSADYLKAYLEGLGMQVLMETEVSSVNSGIDDDGMVDEVALKDDRTLPCDLFLVAAGVRSELELARAAGLQIRQGVIVDAGMRTSDPNIFAAGDVAEFDDKVFGLWPVAVSQAEVAAANAVAENDVVTAEYVEAAPVTMLKVAGIDVTSIGRIRAESEDETVIALEDHATNRYRKLVIADGKIVGAILLGYPDESPGVTEAVKQQIDMTPHLDALATGDWEAIRALV